MLQMLLDEGFEVTSQHICKASFHSIAKAVMDLLVNAAKLKDLERLLWRPDIAAAVRRRRQTEAFQSAMSQHLDD